MITDATIEALGRSLGQVDTAGSTAAMQTCLRDIGNHLGSSVAAALHYTGVATQPSHICSSGPVDVGKAQRVVASHLLTEALIPKRLSCHWYPDFDEGYGVVSSSGSAGTVLLIGSLPTTRTEEDDVSLMALLALSASHVAAAFSRTIRSGSPLSTREIQCLSLIAEGATAKEAARALGIGHRTVEEYVVRSRQTLQVGSTVEAVVHAMRLGWLTEADLSTAAETLVTSRPSSGCRSRTGTQ